MKIRKGFVSNSSSSSFVLLGVMYDGDDIMDVLEEHDLDRIENHDIVGIKYFSIDDEIESLKISPEEIQKDFDKLRGIFGGNADIKWFYGTEYC